MNRNYISKSTVVNVNRHQKGELNDRLYRQFSEMPVSDVDWDTSRGTMVVCVYLSVSDDGLTVADEVFRDSKGRFFTIPSLDNE